MIEGTYTILQIIHTSRLGYKLHKEWLQESVYYIFKTWQTIKFIQKMFTVFGAKIAFQSLKTKSNHFFLNAYNEKHGKSNLKIKFSRN